MEEKAWKQYFIKYIKIFLNMGISLGGIFLDNRYDCQSAGAFLGKAS